MKKVCYLLFAVCFLRCYELCAWPIVASDIRKAWGNPKYNGISVTSDSVSSDFWIVAPRNVGNYDHAGIAMVARKIVEHGGEFCTIQLQASVDSNGHSAAYTTNFIPVQGMSCFWLCEPGFEGPNCNKTSDLGCNDIVLTRSKFAHLTVKSDRVNNIENTVDLLDSGYVTKSDGCANNLREVDVHLAVTEYLANGNGVVAGPVLVATKQPSFHSRANIFANTMHYRADARTLCKQGYPGAGCTIKSASYCTLYPVCPGWSATDFNPDIHKQHKVGGCSEFRCIAGGFGDTKTVCDLCNTNTFKQGVLASGNCHTCGAGEYFNIKTGLCAKATAYTQQAMSFGKVGSMGAVENQCWTQFDLPGYVECVTGKKPQ